MRRHALPGLALAFLTLVQLLPAPAAALFHGSGGASTRVAVNIQAAENAGCSDDLNPGLFGAYPAPDFQARVWIGTRLVHTTFHARDTPYPDWFDLADVDVPGLPATLSIEVREAEPGPTERDPKWVVCDASPEAGSWLNVSVPRDAAVSFDSTGDSAASVRVLGRVAPASLPHPHPVALEEEPPAPDCVHVTWSPPANEPPGTAQTMMKWGGNARLSDDARRYDLCGQPSSWPVHLRLLREWDGWRVAHPDQAFRTADAPPRGQSATPTPSSPPPTPADDGPPPRPTLQLVAGYEEINVTWSLAANDVEGVEVHAASVPFAPSPWTLREQRASASGTAAIPARAGEETHVAVVARDRAGGLSEPAKATATAMQRPAPPAPPAPRVEPGRVALVRWDPPVTAGVARHEVLVAPADAPGDLRVAATAAMPATETGVQGLHVGEDYLVSVRRVNANGLASVSPAVAYHHDPPNLPPVLSLQAVPEHPKAGQAVTLVVRAEDPEGDAVEGTVEWGDGARTNLSTSLQHVFGSPGHRVITVQARDMLGASVETTLLLRVGPNLAPAPDLRVELPASAVVDAAVKLQATGWEDPDGDLVTFEVDWGDGTREPTAPTASHAYASPGRYNVVLTVRDPMGLAASAAAVVVVHPPGEANETPSTAEVASAARNPPSAAAPTPDAPAPTQERRAPSVPTAPALPDERSTVPGADLAALMGAVGGALLARRRRA